MKGLSFQDSPIHLADQWRFLITSHVISCHLTIHPTTHWHFWHGHVSKFYGWLGPYNSAGFPNWNLPSQDNFRVPHVETPSCSDVGAGKSSALQTTKQSKAKQCCWMDMLSLHTDSRFFRFFTTRTNLYTEKTRRTCVNVATESLWQVHHLVTSSTWENQKWREFSLYCYGTIFVQFAHKW